jgi:hypothetical protein
MTAVDEYTPYQKAVWEISATQFSRWARLALRTGLGMPALERNLAMSGLALGDEETHPEATREETLQRETLGGAVLLINKYFKSGGSKAALLRFIDIEEEIATTNPKGN